MKSFITVAAVLFAMALSAKQSHALPGAAFSINAMKRSFDHIGMNLYSNRARWLTQIGILERQWAPIGSLQVRQLDTATSIRLLATFMVSNYIRLVDSQIVQTRIAPSLLANSQSYFLRYSVTEPRQLVKDPVVLSAALNLVALTLQNLRELLTTPEDLEVLETLITRTGRMLARTTDLTALREYNDFLIADSTEEFLARLHESPSTRPSISALNQALSYILSWGGGA